MYSFGNMISHDQKSREGKQTGAARTEELAQSDQPLSVREAMLADRTTANSQASAKQVAKQGTTPDVREEPARATTKAWEWAHNPQKGAKSVRASRAPTGESAAVSESEDTHEQKAWSWATTAFSPHPAKKMLKPGFTSQFTCFTCAKVQILTPCRPQQSKRLRRRSRETLLISKCPPRKSGKRARAPAALGWQRRARYPHFACFSGTKEQILT